MVSLIPNIYFKSLCIERSFGNPRFVLYFGTMWSVLLAGLGLGLFLSVAVGPALFAILRYSLQFGWRAGLSFVAGVSLSDILYVSLANAASGWLGSLMAHGREIGLSGAVLLMGMGAYGLFKKIRVTRNRTDDARVSSRDYWKILGSGFLMNTFNPGVVLTWITAAAAVSNFRQDAPGQGYAVIFFGSCLGLVLGFDILKVFLAQAIRRRLTPRKIVYLNRISALCILVIGLFLFVRSLFGITLGGY